MTFEWGALPLAIFTGAAAAGQLWITRFEQRTGKALFLFVPYEPWSRARNPVLFKMRRGLNYAFVAVFALASLSFLALFMGLSVA